MTDDERAAHEKYSYRNFLKTKTGWWPTKTYYSWNWACFFAGMITLWQLTHSWQAMLAGFVASLHFSKEDRR